MTLTTNEDRTRSGAGALVRRRRPAVTRLTVNVPEAAEMLGIGASTAYAAIRMAEAEGHPAELGGIPVIRLGRRLVMSRAGLEALLGGPVPEDRPKGGK